MKGDGDGVVVPLRRAWPPAAASFSVKDVADATGLPQPVGLDGSLAPRTDTPEGWMYTAEQLQHAIDIADEIRARH